MTRWCQQGVLNLFFWHGGVREKQRSISLMNAFSPGREVTVDGSIEH
jgi:hypothetical protein